MEQLQPKVGSLESWLSDAAAAGPSSPCSASASASPFATHLQTKADAFTAPPPPPPTSRCVSLAPQRLGGQPPLLMLPRGCQQHQQHQQHQHQQQQAELVCTIHNPCAQCSPSSSSTGSSFCGGSSAIDVHYEGTMRRGRPRLYQQQQAAAVSSSLPVPATGGGTLLESLLLCSALSSPASHIAMAAAASSSSCCERQQPQPQPQAAQHHHRHALLHSVSEDGRGDRLSTYTCFDTATAAVPPISLSAVEIITTTPHAQQMPAGERGSSSTSSTSRLQALRWQMERMLLLPLPDDDDDCCADDTTIAATAAWELEAPHALHAATSCSNSTITSSPQRACEPAAGQRAACLAIGSSSAQRLGFVPSLDERLQQQVAAVGCAAAAAAPVVAASAPPPLSTRRGLFEGTVRGGEPRNEWVWAPAAASVTPVAVALTAAAC